MKSYNNKGNRHQPIFNPLKDLKSLGILFDPNTKHNDDSKIVRGFFGS